MVHEIRIQNQVIFLDPPIEYAREAWIRQLHEWLGECDERDGWSPSRLTYPYLQELSAVSGACRARGMRLVYK